MADKSRSDQQNEGEGSRSAARAYNEAQRRFVKSGKVADKAREAKRALEGAEKEELEKAEAEGKRHASEEDPLVKKPGKRPSRH